MSAGSKYEQSGVNYDVLDTFKRACQQAASETVGALKSHGLSEPAGVRGESAYVIETPTEYIAHVEEALGTKTLVADAMYKLTGRSFYKNIALDNVSTIVNDLAASGALPISMAMYAGVGDSEYLADQVRARDLAAGFAEGCRQAGAVWSGGETQTLKGMITPGTVVLGGSAIGRIAPKSNRITGQVRDGDDIIFLASSGVQTNGLTLCRAIAAKLPNGYLTPIADGRAYGEALLDASVIYVKFVAACQSAGIPLNYAAHMTGHGWRKLMRLDAPFVYQIDFVPEPHAVFKFICDVEKIDANEAYATFNMGVGFAVYVDPKDTARALELAKANGYTAWRAGRVKKDGDRKAVEIGPLKIVYGAETLNIR